MHRKKKKEKGKKKEERERDIRDIRFQTPSVLITCERLKSFFFFFLDGNAIVCDNIVPVLYITYII